VSLQAIAAQVGITKPSLLYHFGSKDQLREEVLGTLFEHWAIRLPGLLRAVTTGEGELDALMDALWEFFDEEPHRAQLVVRELLDRPEAMQERIAGSLTPLVSLIAERIRKAQSRGLLRPDADPEAFVVHMLGLTVVASGASPVIFAPVAGGQPDDARRRARDELRRVARASLFPDLPPGLGAQPLTGSVRSSKSE
jgi:TetR/AcrR family transcriptional regulator